MSVLFQKSFAAGEIAPALYARTDIAKYQAGLRTARNGVIQRHGGFYNRPGTTFVGEVASSSNPCRLIEWIYSSTNANTYVLEIGNLTMRFIQSGGYVLENAKNITGITQASPGVFTSASHGYSNNDQVFITGVGGMTQVNRDTFFIVQNVTTNTFTLTDTSGNAVNTTSYGAYTSGGTVARVYTIATPWAAADVFNLDYAQNQNAMYFTHSSYPVQQLVRNGNTNWVLSTVTFGPQTGIPISMSGTAGAGTAQQRYQITAVSSTGEESTPGETNGKGITGITNANPAVVTAPTHGYVAGDQVQIQSVGGMVQLNNGYFTIGAVTTNTFTLTGVDSTSYGVYTSGGAAYGTQISLVNGNAPTASTPNVLNWAQAGGVQAGMTFNIYKQQSNGSYFLAGVTSATTFSDPGITTAIGTQTPPVPRQVFSSVDGYHNIFGSTGNYPSCITFYQQRMCLACSTNNPTTVWTSQIGNYLNFGVHSPQISSDAVTFTIPSQRVSAIQHMRDMGQLVIFTTDGEGSCAGDASGALTPTSINFRQYSYNGSNKLRPIVVDTSALYCQYLGTQIRDLAFDLIVDGYHGNEVNVWSSHLFQGYQLVDWAFAKIPNPVMWAVRSDGTLLGMTYIRDQQFAAWHRHDFNTGVSLSGPGIAKSVCVVPETVTQSGVTISESAVYVIVQRNLGGVTKQYVERFATRYVGNTLDLNYVDSASIFDGRNTGSTTMTLTGGVQWLYTENLTLTASVSTFGSWVVGDQCQMTGSDGQNIRCTVQSITSNTVAVVRSNRTVPSSLQGHAVTNWARAVQSLSGLFHLAGCTVSIYADSCVQANPNNPLYPGTVVQPLASITTAGQVTLPIAPAAVIHLGLPYTSDMETLNYDQMQGQSIGNQSSSVREVTIWCENTRGVWVGAETPSSDAVGTTYTGTIPPLIEAKLRQNENWSQPCNLITDKIEVNVIAEVNNNGRVFVRQSDPLPMAVTGLIQAGMIPQKGAL